MSTRVLAIAVLATLVLVGLGIVATLRLLDARDLLAGSLSAMTGREVAIEKPVKLRLGLPPGLHLEGVRLGKSAEGSPLRSVRVGQLDLVFKLWPLMRGYLDVRRLEVDDIEVVLEPSIGQEGEREDSQAGGNRPYSVEQANVRNLRIELRHTGGAKTIANIDQVRWRSQADGREVDVKARGAIDRIDFDLSGHYEQSPSPSGETRGGALALEGQIAGARVSGQGSLMDENGTPSLDLRLRADAPHLQIFSGVAQRELPQLGPMRASGRLRFRGGTLDVSDLDVRIGDRKTAWLEVTGYARDALNLRKFALDSEFGVSDVRSLGPLVGNPPHIGTVIGKASLHDRSGHLQVEEFTLKGGLPGVLEIDAEGQFEDVKGVNGLDAQVDLKARDLAAIGELFGRTLPPIGPVELRGQVTGHEGEVNVEDLWARLSRTHLKGAFSASVRPGHRRRFTGTVDVPELYLEDLGVSSRRMSEAAGSPDASERGAAAPTRRLFSDSRVDFAWLQIADAQLSFRADRVLGSSGPFASNVRLDVTLEDGKLSLGNVAFGYGADATGELELDSRASPPTLSVRADVKGIQLTRFLEQLGLPRAYSGSLQARVDLKTRGDSPHALASHLDGTIGLTCDGGTIYAEYQSLQMLDLYRAAQRVVGGDRESQPFNCLIAGLEFRSGVGTIFFLLDADDHTTVGEGQVDLAAEMIELRLVPKPHKASLLSTAATLRVVGPLTDPEVKVVKRSLVTSATKAIFANLASASGAHQIWQRLGLNTPVDSPCAKLMGSAP